MSRVVKVAAAAGKDADAIWTWLTSRSPTGADRWHEAWLAAARKLESAASFGTPAPEGKLIGISLYQSFFSTRSGRRYRILYVFDDDSVHVLRIRGPGQDLIAEGDLELS